ncbi:hypothetical protein D9757_001548 [Collybiopsis confluens]|uniref:Uncharacterized protein n=1 Tax=Collybiopsis confluens TaxID=2823264 RepID=A0A8H5HZS2_9AGAR|nr:hypothetical protein D9757_001548 [Collybiopsis confluens]
MSLSLSFPSPDINVYPVGSGIAAPEPDLCKCNPAQNHRCWDVDVEVFGVIHSISAGCSTCDAFVSHIHRSRAQCVQGITEAFAVMHDRHDALWRRGLAEGEARGAQARATAVEQLNFAQIAHAKILEELKALTGVVLGNETMEDFLSKVSVPTFGTRAELQEIADRYRPLWNEPISTIETATQLEEVVDGTDNQEVRSVDSASTLEPFSAAKMLRSSTPFDWSAEDPHSLSRAAATDDPTVCHNNRSLPPTRSSNVEIPCVTINGTPHTPHSTSSSLPPRQRPGHDIPGYYSITSSDNIVWNTLRSLFAKAHSGDAVVLAQCKALAKEAHSVGSEEKTYGMRLVLMQWRNPPLRPQAPSNPDHSISAPTIPTSSSSSITRHGNRGAHARESEVRTRPERISSGLSNPKAEDPAEKWFEYLKTHSTSWPNGVRKGQNGDPNMSDLRASRIHAQVRPPGPPQYPTAYRLTFTISTVSLFGNKGRYRSIVGRLRLRIAPVPRYHSYPGEGGSIDLNVSEEDVARHYATCGVTVKEAEEFIEDWAIHFKGQREAKNR